MKNMQIKIKKKWLVDKATANGLSLSKKIINTDGSENLASSRRVEFRIKN